MKYILYVGLIFGMFISNSFAEGYLALCNQFTGWGIAVNEKTEDQAKKVAQNRCQFGSASGHKIAPDSCFAIAQDKLVVHRKGLGISLHDQQIAIQSALKECKLHDGTECEIINKGCEFKKAEVDQCEGYGLKKNSEKYANCMMQFEIENKRREEIEKLQKQQEEILKSQEEALKQQQAQQLMNNGLKLLNDSPVTTCYPTPGVPNSGYCIK
jgi:hypothetical protein